MTTRRLRQTLFEVERKFSHLLQYPLHRDGGNPPFKSLLHLGIRKFRDIYFDHNQELFDRGIWARQRDGRWELKIRQSGNYNKSQFEELHDLGEIRRHIHNVVRCQQPKSQNFGLEKTVDIVTYRETWRADDRFTLVLDRTDFGHTVGEVELEARFMVQSDAQAQEHCQRMDLEIATFMHRYQWAFGAASPVGKLTAYFNHQRQLKATGYLSNRRPNPVERGCQSIP